MKTTKQNVIFNLLSSSEMQVNHLGQGGGHNCARCSRDEPGRRQFRMRTRENLSIANLPLGYGVSSADGAIALDLARSSGEAGPLLAGGGGGWGGAGGGEGLGLLRGLFFHPKAIVCL